MMEIIAKIWGEERVMVNNALYCGKLLMLKQGRACSLHYHRRKQETFYVLEGKVELELGTILRLMKPGEAQTILPLTPHRFTGVTDAVIIETSTHHDDEDVVRIEPSRVKGKN